ncbi:MAG: alcohol dehydrogenase catalytic domain-containing protein [Candidatus Brocadiia bacterium]
MKAAVLTGPRSVKVHEVPEPPVPEDGLLVRVMACGVCGSDVRRWKEGPPEGVEGIVPGHEVAGVVKAVGPDCEGWSVDDRLALAPDVHCGRCWYCRRGLFNLCDDLRLVGITPGYPGGLAELMPVPGEVLTNGIVHHMPEGIGFAAAGLAEPASSVLACHEAAGTGPRDTVLVVGAGPIGCLHVAVAEARGARTVVSQRSNPRRELARALGPDAVINPLEEDVVERVRELTGGRGADLAVCANPSPGCPATGVRAVRKGGRVVLFGGLARDEHTVRLDGNAVHYGEVEVVGSFSYHPTMHALALDMIHRGLIPADKLITDTFSLEQAPEAFETAAAGRGLKVMVSTAE